MLHRWTKDPGEGATEVVDGTVQRIQDRSACPVTLLNKCQKEWARVWNVRPPEQPDQACRTLHKAITAATKQGGN
eukprot:5087174-Pyramimonas_sp.AAC.1